MSSAVPMVTARGASRNWALSTVTLVAVAVATASGVLAMALATSSNLPFQTALAKLHAPDVVLTMDAAKVTGAELGRTSRLPGVRTAATRGIGYRISTPRVRTP